MSAMSARASCRGWCRWCRPFPLAQTSRRSWRRRPPWRSRRKGCHQGLILQRRRPLRTEAMSTSTPTRTRSRFLPSPTTRRQHLPRTRRRNPQRRMRTSTTRTTSPLQRRPRRWCLLPLPPRRRKGATTHTTTTKPSRRLRPPWSLRRRTSQARRRQRRLRSEGLQRPGRSRSRSSRRLDNRRPSPTPRSRVASRCSHPILSGCKLPLSRPRWQASLGQPSRWLRPSCRASRPRSICSKQRPRPSSRVSMLRRRSPRPRPTRSCGRKRWRKRRRS